MRRNAVILIPAAIVALYAAYALLSRSGGPGSGCGGFHFSRAAWVQGSTSPQAGRTSPRWRTADHLAQCGTLTGDTPAQVIARLGASSSRSARAWRYPVGYDLGDLQYMEVRFSADRHVTGVTSP
ncbi:MAG TPA: hypothetical protein VGI54_00770 [Solirubrobacteraceae bacterium]|jgi:hypothetical protein